MNACTQLDLLSYQPSAEEMKLPVVALTPSAPVTDLPRPLDWKGSLSESRRDYGFFT